MMASTIPSYIKRRLLEHVCSSNQWIEEENITETQKEQYKNMLQRFIQGEPLSRVIGVREFWSLPFHLSPATLDPRPDSETLIEAVLAQFPNKSLPLKVLDLGTGSGCLLLSALSEYPNAQGIGTDIQAEAIETAKKNAKVLNLDSRCQFIQTSWGENLHQTFDIILCNPPYIREDELEGLDPAVKDYDPYTALISGPDGLECYRQVMPYIQKLLAFKGFAFLEMGLGQSKDIESLARQHKLIPTKIQKDLAGIERCLILQYNIP